jgi:hypothetical protein
MTELEALRQAIDWADHFIEMNKVGKERIWCKKPLTRADVEAIDKRTDAIARQHEVKDTLQRIYNRIQLDA